MRGEIFNHSSGGRASSAAPLDAVVEFWRAVEMLSPPAIPEVRPSQQVFDAAPDAPLPWSPRHPLRRQRLTKAQTWRHVVYVGTFAREAVFAALREAFPTAADSFEERPTGVSALAAFVVSEEGAILEGSAVLSACAWAAARALHPGPAATDWLDGFAEVEADFAADLEQAVLGDGGEAAAPLDAEALARCADTAIDALELSNALPVGGSRVRSEIVARRAAKLVEHDFLNSFIADDLARVAMAARDGDVGAALRRYMRPTAKLDLSARIDVREELDGVARATDPDRIPLGRWPADPASPLALGQQLAVDEVLSMSGTGGDLFAVNGPPGTGKTTMLRELVAALVTARAERMAKLEDPAEAFVGEPHRWKTSGFERVVERLRPELSGFELVLASSNNGAVENVTLEIPSLEAIDPEWREAAERVDYLPKLAGRAMRSGRGGNDRAAPRARGSAGQGGANGRAASGVGAEAWALVAARLGNRRNRRDFAQAVWWAQQRTDEDEAGLDPPAPEPGLRDLLSTWAQRPEGPSWADAVAAFESARQRAAAIRDDRSGARERLDRLRELELKLDTGRETRDAARRRVAAGAERRDELARALREGGDARDRLLDERDRERRGRPSILRRGARVRWAANDAALARKLDALDALIGPVVEELGALEEHVRAQARAASAVAAIEGAIEECREALSRVRVQLGDQLPDESWAADRNRRERQAPWIDAEWNSARSELFLAALALHRAFLVHNAHRMRESLAGAMDILSGAAPQRLGAEAARAAWQALFLVVPVVSTTFASVPRLFGPLRAEALGWLLVDEAGQATPQNAVGALWRCRNAVLVGDPLQLEPITTIPFEAEQALRLHYGVEEEWLTSRTSAQGVADRLNRLGTTLPGAERPVWVGAPLTVHRRCDEPMFGIANAIAYDGLMLCGTDPERARSFAAAHPTLPESKWIDVPSRDSHGHWVPAEGAELDRVLHHLRATGFDFTRVMAISPFRDVARELELRARRHRGLTAGTVHTAQGKEADIVVLVLGSDPARDGARAWAAARPNLLNVAVSRARRRLYVIGDRGAWMRHRHFSVLAARLPHDRSRVAAGGGSSAARPGGPSQPEQSRVK